MWETFTDILSRTGLRVCLCVCVCVLIAWCVVCSLCCVLSAASALPVSMQTVNVSCVCNVSGNVTTRCIYFELIILHFRVNNKLICLKSVQYLRYEMQ